MKKIIVLFCGCILLFSGCLKEGPVDGDEEEKNETPVLSMEQEVVELVNRERSKAGLNRLQINESLMESCDVRAKEIVASFSHTRPNGTSCFTTIDGNQVRYRTAGENIAYGQRDAQAVMEAWMKSEGHRNNILSEGYTHIGVGCYESGNTLYWVQLFIGQQ